MNEAFERWWASKPVGERVMLHKPASEYAEEGWAAGAVAERAPLVEALRAILRDPHGCRFCDSGKLRNPDKDHDPDCGYLLASRALTDGG